MLRCISPVLALSVIRGAAPILVAIGGIADIDRNWRELAWSRLTHGLSISHDIIVKQHGGSIEVDTQPGEFTEFRIVLPRAAATIAKSGGRA